uniref:Uncharacterized protein n=1 Tax=viral metagenome TaxID=1070528 RepID=A0A6H1ZC48_9ZZZZ
MIAGMEMFEKKQMVECTGQERQEVTQEKQIVKELSQLEENAGILGKEMLELESRLQAILLPENDTNTVGTAPPTPVKCSMAVFVAMQSNKVWEAICLIRSLQRRIQF